MKEYALVVTKDASDDLRRYLAHIRRVFKNPQAVRNVRNDFVKTAGSLRTLAETMQQPDNEAMRSKNLKRINFQSHNYFLLFRINGDTVEVVQMFHFLEDYENKLR